MSRLLNKLNRQIKRSFGRDDVEDIFLSAAQSLSSAEATDNGQARAAIMAAFPDFLDVINKSYAEYEDRLKISERNIEISSRELNEANRNLEHLNASVNAMMDSLGQGFLFFDKTGTCSPVFSKACVDLLGMPPGGHNLVDVIKLNAAQKDDFQSWL
ncbi:MAG: hypothetical protein KJ667_03995, partial [Alphaproteobacteria bacterium]|nr:hypothetical protein [Alphaproteobacteria bacterium]